MKASILIIDDEKDIRESLSAILRDEGHHVVTSADYRDEQPLENIDIVFQDVWLKKQNGLDILHKIKQRNPNIFVVMISGHGNIDMAVEAVKKDAFDFLEKPLSIERIIQTIANVMQYKEMRKTLIASKNLARKKDPFVMQDKIMEATVEKAEIFLKKNSFLFVCGAAGSGKTALSRYLYYNEEDPILRFQICSLSVVPNDEVATIFSQTNQQFLVVEDVEILNKKNQQHILKILKKKKNKKNKYIFTTRESFSHLEKNRYLDSNFLNMLTTSTVELPLLEQRKKDIAPLISLFIDNIVASTGFAAIRLLPAALEKLQAQKWIGNVSELFNLIERLVLMSPHRSIDADLLEQFMQMNIPYWETGMNFASLKEAAAHFEKSYIYYTVQKHDGNITRVAEELQIERTHLYRKLNKLGLSGIRKKVQEGL